MKYMILLLLLIPAVSAECIDRPYDYWDCKIVVDRDVYDVECAKQKLSAYGYYDYPSEMDRSRDNKKFREAAEKQLDSGGRAAAHMNVAVARSNAVAHLMSNMRHDAYFVSCNEEYDCPEFMEWDNGECVEKCEGEYLYYEDGKCIDAREEIEREEKERLEKIMEDERLEKLAQEMKEKEAFAKTMLGRFVEWWKGFVNSW